MLIFVVIFFVFVFFAPNVLGHPDNYIEANPLVTPSHIVPEWYLLPFYAILRAIPSKLGGVIFMFASIFVLVILPWLDTSKVRSAIFRPLYKQFYWFLVADVIILGYMGAMPAEGIYLLIARVATGYYFVHFLIILPISSLEFTHIELTTVPHLEGESSNNATGKYSELDRRISITWDPASPAPYKPIGFLMGSFKYKIAFIT